MRQKEINTTATIALALLGSLWSPFVKCLKQNARRRTSLEPNLRPVYSQILPFDSNTQALVEQIRRAQRALEEMPRERCWDYCRGRLVDHPFDEFQSGELWWSSRGRVPIRIEVRGYQNGYWMELRGQIVADKGGRWGWLWACLSSFFRLRQVQRIERCLTGPDGQTRTDVVLASYEGEANLQTLVTLVEAS
jgi:hypothetical protein